MNQEISLLEELYSLLISGNYLYDETISFLDFIRIVEESEGVLKESINIEEELLKLILKSMMQFIIPVINP